MKAFLAMLIFTILNSSAYCRLLIIKNNKNDKERRLESVAHSDTTIVTRNFVKSLKKLKNMLHGIKKTFRDVKHTANENMDEILGVMKEQLPNENALKQLNQAETELMNKRI